MPCRIETSVHTIQATQILKYALKYKKNQQQPLLHMRIFKSRLVPTRKIKRVSLVNTHSYIHTSTDTHTHTRVYLHTVTLFLLYTHAHA